MMLPNNRTPTDLPPPDTSLPAGQAAAPAQPNPPHADYNQHPLLVNGLEHYVQPEEDERFHVS